MNVKRRELIRGLACLSGAAAFGIPELTSTIRAWNGDDDDERRLPDPGSSGIEHVVVVMMENRSFDHLLGWLPRADGRQRGLRYPDGAGVLHRTHALAPEFTGCGHVDPDHSYEGGRVEYDSGRIDGFLRTAQDDDYPIGYYAERDRPFFNTLARHYTVLDRSFCSILGPTFPNRFFLHAAQTDRLSNTVALAEMPTIWDSLAEAGVSHRYYYSNLPFLGLWGARYLSIAALLPEFLLDAQTGNLPAVSFVDPRFTIVDDGTGNDDHPHADIRSGDAFMSQVFRAVATGPDWPSTVFIITYDEWGGFFDHVRPRRAAAPANSVDQDLDARGRALLGFRVPTIVASPFSRNREESSRPVSRVFDHTSILKLIEWRWTLPALTARDDSSDVGNLAFALEFEHPLTDLPHLPEPVEPPPHPCPSAGAPAAVSAREGQGETESEWLALLNSGLLTGWPLVGV